MVIDVIEGDTSTIEFQGIGGVSLIGVDTPSAARSAMRRPPTRWAPAGRTLRAAIGYVGGGRTSVVTSDAESA